MNFLVDAHLPYGLCILLRAQGHDAVHTRELPGGNATPDAVLNEKSVSEERVLVTKDTDFYYTHLLHQRPRQLILVRTGNLGRKELLALWERHLNEILEALQTHTLVEIDRAAVRPIL